MSLHPGWFQSTPSLRKVTGEDEEDTEALRISIHTFLAEGDVCSRSDRPIFPISIHTFLAEGDGGLAGKGNWVNYFNPHLPCGRWRCDMTAEPEPDSAFQSTPSLRKVTQRHQRSRRDSIFQSTPSLRKVTGNNCNSEPDAGISIHTFLAEGDGCVVTCSMQMRYFNPHLPCGRWHGGIFGCRRCYDISIHTFLAEGDTGALVGELTNAIFQSTPSLRKVTAKISIIKFL